MYSLRIVRRYVLPSQGDTEQKALENLKEAIEFYFEDSPGVERFES